MTFFGILTGFWHNDNQLSKTSGKEPLITIFPNITRPQSAQIMHYSANSLNILESFFILRIVTFSNKFVQLSPNIDAKRPQSYYIRRFTGLEKKMVWYKTLIKSHENNIAKPQFPRKYNIFASFQDGNNPIETPTLKRW